MSLTKNWT